MSTLSTTLLAAPLPLTPFAVNLGMLDAIQSMITSLGTAVLDA